MPVPARLGEEHVALRKYGDPDIARAVASPAARSVRRR